MKQRILFIDDESHILDSYKRVLRGQQSEWDTTFVCCPVDGWARLQAEHFDCVVTDVRMPRMTGLELLSRLKQNEITQQIPVIIVTVESDRDLKRKALDLNATDLLNKPVNHDDLFARIRNSLRLKQYEDKLKHQNNVLEQKVRVRTAALAASRLDIIWRLGKAAEFRDEETGNHVIRVGCYSRTIARALGMDEDFTNTIFLASPLHDIGKIGISDTVLLKPGRLTDDEWTIMRKHCEMGVSILADDCKFMDAARRYGGLDVGTLENDFANPLIRMASSIAQCHHEKWNGRGYPNGLAGEDIPLEARIVAIADVYDALRSRRPYKTAFSIEKSLAILEDDSGTHFDPDVHAAFVESFEYIQAIENEFSDSQPAEPLEAIHDELALC